jgi:hypothetical protein
MNKLLIIAVVALASCTQSVTTTAPAIDSVSVDSVAVDTLAVDTAAVVDTTK